MNIFVTSDDPAKCAKVLDDKRVVKMIVETCQILSTVMHKLRLENAPYKPTHMNHPCVNWASFDYRNFYWLLNHLKALINEYNFRYPGRIHSCENLIPIFENVLNNKGVFRRYLLYQTMQSYSPKDTTCFENCTPYKNIKNVFEAYKLTLLHKWKNDKRTPKWYGEEKSDDERKAFLDLN